MRILITGAGGLLGRTLVRRWQDRHALLPLGRAELDVCDAAACHAAVTGLRPDAVVHCAAATAVDRCETQREEAFRINARGSAAIAAACHRAAVRLVAISTDYVFSGALGRPCDEWDRPDPVSVYGISKLAGEQAVREHCPDHCIVRTAWLYGSGGQGFVQAMLRLGAADGPPLRVVDDQRGDPTSATALADGLERVLMAGIVGTVHLSCAGGGTTRYDLAREILALRGLVRSIEACSSGACPRPAPRPADSRLDNMVMRLHAMPALPHWREALADFLQEHPDG